MIPIWKKMLIGLTHLSVILGSILCFFNNRSLYPFSPFGMFAVLSTGPKTIQRLTVLLKNGSEVQVVRIGSIYYENNKLIPKLLKSNPFDYSNVLAALRTDIESCKSSKICKIYPVDNQPLDFSRASRFRLSVLHFDNFSYDTFQTPTEEKVIGEIKI